MTGDLSPEEVSTLIDFILAFLQFLLLWQALQRMKSDF